MLTKEEGKRLAAAAKAATLAAAAAAERETRPEAKAKGSSKAERLSEDFLLRVDEVVMDVDEDDSGLESIFACKTTPSHQTQLTLLRLLRN